MGRYINKTSTGKILGASFIDKVTAIKEDGGTVIGVDQLKYQPGLICIVDNGMFAAAGYCYSENEYNVFRQPDGRRKLWMTHPKAEELAN